MMRALRLPKPRAAMPESEATARRLDALVGQIKALDQRLATVEDLLRGLYGATALGVTRPVQPPPEAERALRPVATLRL